MAANQNDATEMVRVYEMVSPDHLLRFERQLREVFALAAGVDSSRQDFIFHISSVSGWIYFEVGGFLRPTLPPLSLAKDMRMAVEQADSFLKRLSSNLSDAKRFPFVKDLSDILVIPQTARAIDAGAVLNQAGSFPEHWLVRYEVSLPGFEDSRARFVVSGSQLEVRVGNAGLVVGCSLRWSPLRRAFLRVPYVPFVQRKDSHVHSNSSEEEPLQVYPLHGDGIPQFYLAPYHQVTSGHHAALYSASKYSLEVRFLERHSRDEMEITVEVGGGSGDYSYNWGYYALDSVLETGVLVSERDEPILKISPPIYAIVACHVLDRKTRAYHYHAQQVIGSPQYEEVSLNSPLT